MAAACVVVGGLPLYGYELWVAHRGAWAWSAVAAEDEKIVTLGWRKLWWWILLSYVMLIGCIILSTALQQMLTSV